MAELNFGALARPGPRGFAQGFEQGQEQRMTEDINRTNLETGRFKLDELKRDRAEMMQLQTQLKGMGQDPDLDKLMDVYVRSGRPDYVKMGLEGKQKLKEQREYAKLIGGGMAAPEAPAAAAPAAPAAPPVMRMPQAPAPTNALGSGTFGMGAPAAPVNALAAPAPAPAAAPANALANPNAGQIQQTQKRINDLMQFAATNPGMATQAMQQAKLLQDQLEMFSKRGPAESADVQTMRALGIPITPEGYQQFTGAKRQDRLLTPEELKQKLQIAGAGANRTEVKVSTEKNYGQRFGGLIADQDASKLAAAEAAPQAAATADRVLDLISTGKVITGTGANVRLQLAKALNLAGGTDSEKIRNTEVLMSSLAETTLGAIKSSNLGAGQGFTNADRDFLEKAKAGQLTYDSGSLAELARLARLAAEKSAEVWNKRVKQIPASALEGTGISSQPVVVSPRKTSSVMNIPQEAIDMLKSGAGTREQFDGTFGPGSAARILKGK